MILTRIKKMVEKYEINDTLPVFLNKENKEIFRLRGEVEKKKLLKIVEENKEK